MSSDQTEIAATEKGQWTPDSWRSKKVVQDVQYEDDWQLQQVLGKLGRLPPLVSYQEV